MTLTADSIAASAGRLGMPPEAIAAAVEALSFDPGLLASLHTALETGAMEAGLVDVKAAELAKRFGVAGAAAFRLALALSQVPHAAARSLARGVDEASTWRTLADLVIWVRNFHQQVGGWGLTAENLGWAQRYLRGTLVAVGFLQFDVIPLQAPLCIHRHTTTGALCASFDGKVLDLATGETREAAAPQLDSAWECLVAPGLPVLDLHIPAGGRFIWSAAMRNMVEALELFARLQPDVSPVAVCGEAWVHDPQVATFLPRSKGYHSLQQDCLHYPSALPELGTIRRLFGPKATREEVVALPREGLDSLRRAVADFLSEPGAQLRARGAMLLKDQLMEAVRA